LKFLFAIAQHAFLLVTFRHTGKGLPSTFSGCLIVTLIVCAFPYAWIDSPQTGVWKLLVWSVLAIFSPAYAVAAALISALMSVLSSFVGMSSSVHEFWHLTALLVVVARILR
jgi:hypothetical protein